MVAFFFQSFVTGVFLKMTPTQTLHLTEPHYMSSPTEPFVVTWPALICLVLMGCGAGCCGMTSVLKARGFEHLEWPVLSGEVMGLC